MNLLKIRKIEPNKNKNVTDVKDVSFSWIRKILEDKITLESGIDVALGTFVKNNKRSH